MSFKTYIKFIPILKKMSRVKFFPIKWVQSQASMYCYGRSYEDKRIIVETPFSPYVTGEIEESLLLTLLGEVMIVKVRNIGKYKELSTKDLFSLQKLIKILEENKVSILDKEVSMKWKFFKSHGISPMAWQLGHDLRAPIGEGCFSKGDEIHYYCNKIESLDEYSIPKTMRCLFYCHGVGIFMNSAPYPLPEESLVNEVKTRDPDFVITSGHHPLSTVPLKKCSSLPELKIEWLKLLKFCNVFLCDPSEAVAENEEKLLSHFFCDKVRCHVKRKEIEEGIFRDVVVYSLEDLYYRILCDRYGEREIRKFKDYSCSLFYSGYYEDLTSRLPKEIKWISDKLVISPFPLPGLVQVCQAQTVVVWQGSLLIDEMRMGTGVLANPPFNYLKKYIDYFMKHPVYPIPLIEPSIEDFICKTSCPTPELETQMRECKMPLGGNISYIKTRSGFMLFEVYKKCSYKCHDSLDLEWYKRIINHACSVFLS